MDDFEKELRFGFLDEAAELLSSSEQCFLDLEKSADNPEILEKIFRLAHNLKGSAGAVGFVSLKEFTHQLESFLLKLKKKEILITPASVNVLLQCNDHLKEFIQRLRKNPDDPFENKELLAQLENTNHFEDLSEVVEMSLKPLPQVKTTTQAPGEENIRVSLAKLDHLLNNVGELVILQTVLSQQSFSSASLLMQKTAAQMAKVVKEIQTSSMSLRMVPVRQTFQKMQRIVRDTSKALNKDIELILQGEEIELDKTVIEQLGDPLVHLVRNAVDHGIESSEERQACGKNARGSIKLSAYHQGSQIVIQVQDDGKGLDAKKLVNKATEKGLLPSGATVSDEAAYQLVFAPGFSTKAEVTDVSGRGVGMDVVKTNIEQIQGEIELETRLGEGTSFKVLLPMTLAITDALVIQTGPERYVIPISQISESLQPKKEDVSHVGESSEILNLRGESLPLYRLSHLLKRHTRAQDNTPAWENIALIVRDSGKKSFSILVDDVVCQQQVVIKRLGEEIRNLPGVTGAAILGDGKASLILDVFQLVQRKANFRKGVA